VLSDVSALSAPGAAPGGDEMQALIERLYPICRSITGDGVRKTLHSLREYIPLELREVPTGTPVFDWVVPKEWNIRDAYIKAPSGERVVDFRESNLHVVSYSVPVRERLPLSELREHLHSLPERPDWIPYRTSYWNETWGYCLPHKRLLELGDAEYEVCIDSSLEEGHLTYGELALAGETDDEVLISTHICHPSLCNDNLSGVAVATFLARRMAEIPRRRYRYRFVFVPGMIGPITWLALNEDRAPRIRHGLVLALLGDPGSPTYKRSRRGNAEIDRAAEHVLRHSGGEHRVIDFSPYGYDERQYCSPGINLPVGRLTRTPHGEFPEYHTSADDLDLVRPEYLADSFAKTAAILDVLEGNATYLNESPKGEPQLGRRGLYRSLGGGVERERELAMLWVLNLSDGGHSLLDVAERSGLPFQAIRSSAEALLEHGLLREVTA
jgi:aminopeptidase-like protein